MRRVVSAALLAGLLGALAYVGWPLLRSGFRVGGAPSSLESRWQTEEHWLVDSIVRDLAEMARFAADSKPPAAGEVDVTVASSTPGAGPVKVGVQLRPGRQVERDVALATFVWSPEEYRDLGRALDELERESEEPGLRAWCRGLRLRLTDDIRIRPQDATFLERRELYGAMIRCVF